MGLIDDLKDNGKLESKKNSICSVCKMIASLTKAEQEALAPRMEDPDISHAALSRVLQANGHQIMQGTLARHRNKECQRVFK